ncbi:ead/Ea22-like family protein [Enterobacter roggenkampii]|uniref:ead/Ea22-like family protein n=1 Tax=Enterobacter roggenkampii TaxID=1812935 RepID=UPI00201A1F05|nr:ead/Ea22-like family protein [Enterobacter roggenkampii]UQQ39994.1 ead/Ea22-like family protein [Enterobacter roggenkampii]
MIDITKLAQILKAAAEKATPGEWRRASTQFNGITATPFMLGRKEVMIAGISEKRDAEFIAMANPANVLALLEALEKAQQRISELEEAEQKLCAANVTLDARAELADRQLAELESRTVKLPQRHSMLLREDFSEDYHTEMAYKADEVQASLAAVGIKVEDE